MIIDRIKPSTKRRELISEANLNESNLATEGSPLSASNILIKRYCGPGSGWQRASTGYRTKKP